MTCSVGIAPNRLLAKIGSEQNKPDGFTLMPFEPGEIAAFLRDKPIGILWGAGKKTVESLKPYGIATCGDLQRLGRGSPLVSDDLIDMAFGISDDKVYWEPGEEKSVSREHTFDEDTYDRETVRETLLELVTDVGRRFRRATRSRCATRTSTRSRGRRPSRIRRATTSPSERRRSPSSTANGPRAASRRRYVSSALA